MHARSRSIIFAGIGLALLLIPMLSGCAAARAPILGAATEAPREQGGYGGEVTAIITEEAIQEVDVGPAATNAPAAGQPQGSPEPDLVAALPQERMIIKNGEIDLLVQSTDAAIDQVTQIATDNGGYVLSSQSSLDYNGVKSATLTIAVRADQFETAMRRLRQIAIQVQRELSTGEDVTSEYVDLESRLRNLEATRDRIMSFLADAKTVDEALRINQQLADIEAEIEQVKGRMNYLAGRSAFSTITVNLQQKVDATPTPTPTLTPTPTATPLWSLGPTIEDATRSQTNLARGLLEAVTWLAIVPGPYCMAGGLILWGVVAVTRRRKGSAPPKSGPPADES